MTAAPIARTPGGLPARLTVRRATELASVHAPAGELTADEADVLTCTGCRRPLTILTDYAAASCLTYGCEMVGYLMMITDLSDVYAIRHGDPNPAGAVRPRLDGRPVPWLTPVIGRVAYWRYTHGVRLAAAQERWWCQVCGEPLEDVAAAVCDRFGRLFTAAGCHRRCAAVAVARCPRLAAAAAERDVLIIGVRFADLTGVPPHSTVDESAGYWAVEAGRRPVLELPAPTTDWDIDPDVLVRGGRPLDGAK